MWANELAGALHSTIAYVEIAVRNAICTQLAVWNTSQGGRYGPEWALDAAPLLYELLGKALRAARSRAHDEANLRSESHPRYGAAVTNDDVIAQVMFGSWVQLVHPISGRDHRQARLWTEGIHRAFPAAEAADAGRLRIGQQLERVRRLRNRVAHHLLGVEVPHRLNDMLAILRGVDPAFPSVAMSRSQVRRVIGSDPRRAW